VTTFATSREWSYLADLLAGMAVNLEIAGTALGLGLVLGVPLGLMQLGGRLQRSLVAPLIGLMRAAPTFVVMFFLLNVIPQPVRLFGLDLTLPASMIVAVSLVPYAAAYAADNGRDAFLVGAADQRRRPYSFCPISSGHFSCSSWHRAPARPSA
jgi:ABC-type amino acid transport system permease subunit